MKEKKKKTVIVGIAILAVVLCGLGIVLVCVHNTHKKQLANISGNSNDTLEDSSIESPDANQSDKTILRVEEVKAHKGENVRVKVTVENNPGILGMKFSVFYDDTVLKLDNADNGEAFADILTMTSSKALTSGCNFVWDGQEIEKTDIKNGVILELNFIVDDDASVGSYPVTVVCAKDDAVDGDLKSVEFDIVNGCVEVTE